MGQITGNKQVNIGQKGVYVLDGAIISSAKIRSWRVVTKEMTETNPKLIVGEIVPCVELAGALGVEKGVWAIPVQRVFWTLDAALAAWHAAGYPTTTPEKSNRPDKDIDEPALHELWLQ